MQDNGHKNMTSIFRGFSSAEVEAALRCLSAEEKCYEKGQYILEVNDPVTSIGIVSEGMIYISKYDVLGGRNIVSESRAGDLFGEALIFSGIANSMYSITAACDCKILFIKARNIVDTEQPVCRLRGKIIENLLTIISRKNISLNQKIDILSHKALRDRILCYLLTQKRMSKNKIFEVPFSRNDLADFLNVDRSALSRELSRMKKEGIIDYHKNSFQVR